MGNVLPRTGPCLILTASSEGNEVEQKGGNCCSKIQPVPLARISQNARPTTFQCFVDELTECLLRFLRLLKKQRLRTQKVRN